MKLGVSEMRNGNLAKYPYGIGVSPNEGYEGKDALLPRHPAQGEISSSSAPVSKHTRHVGSSPFVGRPPKSAEPLSAELAAPLAPPDALHPWAVQLKFYGSTGTGSFFSLPTYPFSCEVFTTCFNLS